MRNSFFFSVAVVALATTAVGCGGGRGRRPPGELDAGMVVRMDGGIPPGTDAGGPPGTDAGIPPGTDAGVPPGRDAGTPPRVDAGGGRTCDGSIVTTATGLCSAASITCAMDCTSGACIDTCLMGGGPDCAGCANNNIIACANENGCQALWDAFNCCYLDYCETAADPSACATTTCGTSRTAYQTCITTGPAMAAMCGGAWYDCR